MATQAKKKVVPKWIKSRAKKNLRQDIIDRVVTDDMGAREVYNTRPEYKDYDFTRFSANLRALRKVIAENKQQAVEDLADYYQDMNLHPRPAMTNRGYPFWDTSEAKLLLEKDIEDELHLDLTPSELWQTQHAYQLFPLTTFRNHIYQQIRTVNERAYWLHQRELKRNKMK
jgi:hypothetical protein